MVSGSMSISDTISQYAATSPAVANAQADANTKSALLYSLQSGDSATGGLLGSLSQQANEVESLLASASPSFLGQNIDIKA